MIIFEIDDVLADTRHRKHWIDGKDWKNLDIPRNSYGLVLYQDNKGNIWNPKTINDFKPDYAAYNADCIDDRIIKPLFDIFERFYIDVYGYPNKKIEIWSTRCESQRKKTIEWLENQGINGANYNIDIKMRPIGNETPIGQLKEKWAKEFWESLSTDKLEFKRQDIDMVFASDLTEIAMWRRHGVFVFDCNQRE